MITIPIDDPKVDTPEALRTGSNEEEPRVVVRKPRDGSNVKFAFWLTASSSEDLREVRAMYRRLVDRDVALSVVMRRALRELREQLDCALYEGRGDGELAQLMRHSER